MGKYFRQGNESMEYSGVGGGNAGEEEDSGMRRKKAKKKRKGRQDSKNPRK